MESKNKKKIHIISRVEENEDKKPNENEALNDKSIVEVENVTFIGRVEEKEPDHPDNLLEKKSGGLKAIIEASGTLNLKTNIFEV
jgi:hypothetical protein